MKCITKQTLKIILSEDEAKYLFDALITDNRTTLLESEKRVLNQFILMLKLNLFLDMEESDED